SRPGMVPPDAPFPSGVRATAGPHALLAPRRPPDRAAVRGLACGGGARPKNGHSANCEPAFCTFLLPRARRWGMMGSAGPGATCTPSGVWVAAGRMPCGDVCEPERDRKMAFFFTHISTAGNETINGTPSNDVLVGNGGDDLVSGDAGDDAI